MLKFLKKNFKTIALVISLTLNALGGSGVIPPVVGKTFDTVNAVIPAP